MSTSRCSSRFRVLTMGPTVTRAKVASSVLLAILVVLIYDIPSTDLTNNVDFDALQRPVSVASNSDALQAYTIRESLMDTDSVGSRPQGAWYDSGFSTLMSVTIMVHVFLI